MGVQIYLLVTGFIVLLTYLINNHVKNRRFWMLVNEFYGDKPLPIIGNALQFGSNTEEYIWKSFEIFKRANFTTYKFLIGNKVFINLCEPDTVEVLLSNNKEINKMEAYSLLKDWLGDGLVVSSGSKWRKRRKFITKTFHFKILDQFIKVFNSNGKTLIDLLSKEKGKVFDIFPFVNNYALDVICESAMGVSINAQTNENSEYVKAVHNMCRLVKERIMSSWRKYLFLYQFTNDYKLYSNSIKIIHSMTNNVIKNRREILKDQIERVANNEIVHIDEKELTPFLDLLLLSEKEDGCFLSDEDIREETDTFMYAGHDTTTSTISFTLYMLANHPDIQQKVVDEILNIIGHDKNFEITQDHIQQMKYMEMVIKETLRLYPSVPGFGRRIESDLTLPDGRILPAGCCAIVDLFGLFRNPKYFKDPDTFDPERFSADNGIGKNPYLFIPFSAGSRNCIGQKFAMLEVKCILAKILLNFELVSWGVGKEVRIMSEITLKAKNGINIILKERHY